MLGVWVGFCRGMFCSVVDNAVGVAVGQWVRALAGTGQSRVQVPGETLYGSKRLRNEHGVKRELDA